MKFEITIVHKFENVEAILAAIEKIAHPPLPETKAEPVKPPSPYEVEFEEWVTGSGFSETQASHYRAAFKVILGKMPVPPGHSKVTLRDDLMRHGAPIPIGV